MVTFATPLIQVASRQAPSIISTVSKTLNNLFKNKGVQIGIGLGATGGGLAILNESAKNVTAPLGIQGSSTLLIVGIIVIVLLVMMKK